MIAVAFLVAIRYERRYLRTIVRRSRGQAVRGAMVALGFQAAAAVLDIAVGGFARATNTPAVAWAIAAPVVVTHGALILMALPDTQYASFRRNRRDLRAVGASDTTATAIAWGGGIGAILLGLPTIAGTVILTASAG